eukprot:COSAG06_NODE_698_length_12975_cov_108.592575_8_plen_118_part_00
MCIHGFVSGAEGIGKKTGFLSHLYIKVMILPRQARDKHRENSKKARFVAGRAMFETDRVPFSWVDNLQTQHQVRAQRILTVVAPIKHLSNRFARTRSMHMRVAPRPPLLIDSNSNEN